MPISFTGTGMGEILDCQNRRIYFIFYLSSSLLAWYLFKYFTSSLEIYLPNLISVPISCVLGLSAESWETT